MRKFAVSTALLFSSALGGGTASAASLPLTEGSCGPDGAWRCYSTQVVSLVTTFESPHAEWTIDMVLPEDPQNWTLVSLSGVVNGTATYSLTYPDTSHSGGAGGVEVAFRDSTGFEFASAGRALMPGLCNDRSDGTRDCFDGDVMQGGAQYGAPALPQDLPLSPTLPPFVGPVVTLSVDWHVTGDQPESSSLEVDGAWFGYALAPVPEPGTGLLTALGLLGMALARRSGVPRGRRVDPSHG